MNKKEKTAIARKIDKIFKIIFLIIGLYILVSLVFFKSFYLNNGRIMCLPLGIIFVSYSIFNITRGIKLGEIIVPRIGLVKHKNKPTYYWFGFSIHTLSFFIGIGFFIAFFIFSKNNPTNQTIYNIRLPSIPR